MTSRFFKGVQPPTRLKLDAFFLASNFMLFDGFAGERHRKEGQGVLVQCPAKVPGEKIASLVRKPFYPNGRWVGTEINTSQLLPTYVPTFPFECGHFPSLRPGKRCIGNHEVDLFNTHSIHGTNGIFTYKFSMDQ